jgi:tRNA modification GTPase
MGYQGAAEGGFMARRRHLDAIERAAESLQRARYQLEVARAAELVAEELRLAQVALGEITGEFTSEDLLGRIFASFCIGK